MRAILIGDVHLRNDDNPPSIRTPDYSELIRGKLEWSIDRANELAVDCVIQLGDLFDHKIPHRTSHKLIQDTMDIFAKANMPVFVVTGNHCISNDQLSSLPKQPLGVILRMPNVHSLHGYNEEFNINGIPYMHDPDDWNQFMQDSDKWDSATLVCMHASIFPRSEMPPYDAVSAEELAPLMPANYIAYGHIHNPPKKGAYYKVGTTWFCNRGAISRGTLHEENLVRTVGITLFDSTNKETPFTNIDLPMKPAEEVFTLDKKQLTDERRNRVEDFISSIDNVESVWLTKDMIKGAVLQAMKTSQHRLVDQVFDSVG